MRKRINVVQEDEIIFERYFNLVKRNWYMTFPLLYSFKDELQLKYEIFKNHLLIWDGDDLYFPPIGNHPNEIIKLIDFKDIGMDYEGFKDDRQPEFFVNEYIKDPAFILNLKGKKLKRLRQGLNIFNKEFNIKEFQYREVKETDKEELKEFIIDWVMTQGKKNEIIYDFDYTNNLIDNIGKIKSLDARIIKYKNKIVSLNIWSESPDWIHYLVNKNCLQIKNLSFYSRYLFYKDIVNKNKLVNDGGDLDNEGIKRFKNYFAPIEIKKLYTWKKA